MKWSTWTAKQIVSASWHAALVLPVAALAEAPPRASSYAPVAVAGEFPSILSHMKGAKAGIGKRQSALLEDVPFAQHERYSPIEEGIRHD